MGGAEASDQGHGEFQSALAQSLGMSRSEAEQRGSARLKIHGVARVRLPRSHVLPGRVFDMSRGGVSVFLDVSLPHGVVVDLCLNIFRNGRAHDLQLQARSMYALLCSRDGFRNGFDFVHLDPAAEAQLSDLLA